MRILGIDPGLAIVGYGVIDAEASRLKIVDYGTVETGPEMPLPRRLERIYAGVQALIAQFSPEAIAIEELFFYRNVTTAIAVGHARGVAMLACTQTDTDMFEYTPMQVKLAVTGHGHAQKAQVQQMVRMLLNLREIPRPDDAADALAIAICHAHTSPVMRQEFRIK